MSRTRTVLALFALVAAAGASTWHSFKPELAAAGKKATDPPAVPVKLVKATVGDMALRLEITGRTEPYETVALKSRVEGQVQTVAFTEGQHVRKGDVLLRLDPADFLARLNQAEANLERSQVQLAKARADVERYIALRAKGFVSDEKVGEMRANASAIESTSRADAAAADLARLQLSYTAIRAPFAGVVGAKLVFPGAAVKINETTLAAINRVQPLYVGFAVPEKYLPQLQAGMRSAGKALDASISLPGGGTAWQGAVRFLDHGVDVATGTIQLKAILRNEDERFTPGQFVNVSLVLDTLRDAVVIPAEAVQQGVNGSFVFVARADSSVEVRTVRIASVQQQLAVVAEGLSGDEAVVTEGQLRLTPGARIRPTAGAQEKPVNAGGKAAPAQGKPDLPDGRSGKSG